ncbi:beta-1,3-galactosyl-O-glycosyl-glycoprotein beta-1,6-N-acetylglucosaminyltransferase-like, partial [Ruditapes philippinarum]|uniref:beta-1,3-galactosyl-O-glycosyl-glycoprotein beta-1,6-N-acetylglucosaminyltransferase-like n=1 Tax=Ruditapes philippinarum TaxID=129788 RepID=UPI00295BA3E2
TYSTVPNCRKIHKDIEDVSYFAFQEEIDVQIAYSILVYKDYQMVEFLLRTIYKPQNTYCIHVDNKSPKFFENSVRGLATCFQNVFIATKPVNVYWGNFSVVEAEMSCMKDLLNKSKSWKYFINLTGQEFPLRTNYEIAKVLIALRGYNNMKCSDRIKKSDLLISGAPPYGLTAYKTSTHVVLTREFVEYILYNKTAKAVLNWTKQLKIPSDEIAFSTLNCNQKLKAPGSYRGHPNVYNRTLNYIARFKVWIGKSFHVCNGKSLRGICTFGPKDLETLQSRYELFANKFNIRAFPQVPYCLRNTLLRRTFLEYTGRLDYNVTYYENIPHRI